MGVSETVQIKFTTKDGASRGIAKIRGETTGLNKGLGKLASAAKLAGVALAAGLAVGFAKAVKEAAAFDKQLRNIDSIAKLTTEEFKAMNDQVLEMSKDFPQSAEDMASSLYDVYSSGFQGELAMKVLETAAKGASAGLTETKTAGKGLMAVMNAYNQKTGPDAERIMDLMFKTVEKGVTTFEELSGSVGGVISTASAAGVTFEEVSAGFATMTKGGISTAESATALNQVMLSFIKPGEEMASMISKLGYESGSAAIESDGFSTVLLKMAEETDGNVEAMAKLFPNVRALKGALSLTREEGAVFTEDLKNMEEALGSTDEAFQRQSEGFQFQYELLKGKLNVALIKLGSVILPQLIKVFDYVSPLIEKAVDYFSDLFGTIDKESPIIKFLIKLWDEVVDAFMVLKNEVIENKELFMDLGKILGGVLLISIYNFMKMLKALIQVATILVDWMGAIRDATVWLQSAFFGLSATILEFILTVGSKIAELFPQATEWGKHLIANFVKGIEESSPLLFGILAKVGGMVTESMHQSYNPLIPAKHWGEGLIKNFADGIKAQTDDTLAAALDGVTDEEEKALKEQNDILKEALDQQEGYVNTAVDAIVELGGKIKPFWEAFKEGADEIKKAYRKLRDDIKLQISDLNTAWNNQNNEWKNNFKQTLAENVLSHEKNIEELKQQSAELTEDYNESNAERLTNLKESLAAENAAYAKSNADRLSGLQSGIAKEIVESQERLSEAEKALKEERSKGEEMNQDTITDLQARIDEENSFLENHKNDIIAYQDAIKAYTDWINMDSIEQLKSRYVTEQAAAGEANIQAIASLQSKYAEEKALADQSYQEKLAQLNLELADNQAFLDLHAEEIDKYQKKISNLRAFYRLDDVEQAKQTWKKERKAAKTHYEKELEILTAALETAKTKRTNKLAKLQEETKDKFQQIQIDLTDTMDYLFTKLTDKAGEATDRLKEKMAELSGIIGGYVGKTETSGIAGFADGGIVPGPIGSPQLAVVHGGEKISTVGGADRGSSTININFNNPTVRSDADLNYIAGVVTEKLSRLNERIRLSGGI